MDFDFDRPFERRGTDSLKWDVPAVKLGAPGAIPMWVADMDFPAPPAVIEAVRRRAEHGAYGYPSSPASVFEAAAGWMKTRHGWDIRPEWISRAPGVVPSLYACVRAFSLPGDGVVLQTPVYTPFFSAVEDSGRRIVRNPLRLSNGRWFMDFDDFERRLDGRTKLLVLCSPHNPVGRVWTADELARLARICAEHGMTIVADEIHGDLVFKGHRHLPLASLGPDAEGRTITLAAPSKTFNIAGLSTSLAIASSADLRNGFRKALRDAGFELPNVFGLPALEAAYRHGGPWLDALLEYLEGNIEFAVRFFDERLRPLRLLRPEGTYLALIDGRALGLAPADLDAFFLRKAGVYFTPGGIFGNETEGYERLNFACSRALLAEALSRIEAALAASSF